MGGIISNKKELELMAPVIREMNVDVKNAKNIPVYDNFWEQSGFVMDKMLGSGASCKVARGKLSHKKISKHAKELKKKFENGHICAIKEMKRKDEFNPASYVKEIAILHLLTGHPNLLVFENAYLDKTNYFIQTALLKGGELFDRIHDEKRFNEETASRHICRILDAILWCHNRSIVHRDLKPENMVYAVKRGGPETLVLIDFGDAKYVEKNQTYEEFVGTAFYLPPEIVRKRTGEEMKKSDVWSIGVIAYVLLTGRPPFWGTSNKEILKKIIKGKVQFPKSAKLSATAKHFVLNLVQKRIEKRFNVAFALDHPFIKNHNKGILNEIRARHGLKASRAAKDSKRKR